MRDIAIDHYPIWQHDDQAILKVCEEYLSKQDFIAFKCWDQGLFMASAFMHLDDVCHYIIVQLS